MAKTVEDTAVVLQALAGHDPNDPATLRVPVPDYRSNINAGIDGLKVGVLEEFLGDECEDDIVVAVRKAIVTLNDLGADVQSVSIAHARDAKRVCSLVAAVESAAYYPETFNPDRLQNLDADVQAYLERGRSYSSEQYREAQRTAALLRQEATRALNDVDVLVAPTCQTLALPRDVVKVEGELLSVTAIASATGLPAISLPCGYSGGQLPVGLEIIGRHLEESVLLRTAHSYQQATDWHLKHPQVP